MAWHDVADVLTVTTTVPETHATDKACRHAVARPGGNSSDTPLAAARCVRPLLPPLFGYCPMRPAQAVTAPRGRARFRPASSAATAACPTPQAAEMFSAARPAGPAGHDLRAVSLARGQCGLRRDAIGTLAAKTRLAARGGSCCRFSLLALALPHALVPSTPAKTVFVTTRCGSLLCSAALPCCIVACCCLFLFGGYF